METGGGSNVVPPDTGAGGAETGGGSEVVPPVTGTGGGAGVTLGGSSDNGSTYPLSSAVRRMPR
jgi:hypothetical protein